jgi:hypothetical protein
MHKICLVLGVVVFGFSMPALAEDAKPADVGGDWNMTLTTPMGEHQCTLHFDQDGETITVKMTDPMGAPIDTKGAVTGNEVKWSAASQTPMGEMIFDYVGTVEGDVITGTATMVDMPMPPSDWKATR